LITVQRYLRAAGSIPVVGSSNKFSFNISFHLFQNEYFHSPKITTDGLPMNAIAALTFLLLPPL
jgi:hypothetical protein